MKEQPYTFANARRADQEHFLVLRRAVGVEAFAIECKSSPRGREVARGRAAARTSRGSHGAIMRECYSWRPVDYLNIRRYYLLKINDQLYYLILRATVKFSRLREIDR